MQGGASRLLGGERSLLPVRGGAVHERCAPPAVGAAIVDSPERHPQEIEVSLDPRRIVGMQVDPCAFLRTAIPDNVAAGSWSGCWLRFPRVAVLPLPPVLPGDDGPFVLLGSRGNGRAEVLSADRFQGS